MSAYVLVWVVLLFRTLRGHEVESESFESVWNQTAVDQIVSSLTTPAGFCVSLFHDGFLVPNARTLTLSKSSPLLYISTAKNDKVFALRDENGDGVADGPLITLLDNLTSSPMGLAWHEGDLYVAEVGQLYKISDIDNKVLNGTLDQAQDLELVTTWANLTHHGDKFIGIGPDGKLYVNVGAPCNICLLDTWDAALNLTYGAIWRMNTDGTSKEQYASGVRNSVGMDWHPDTGELWFTDNGRDLLGDNSPDDELNYAPQMGQNFGFPYCHTQGTGDPYTRDPGPGTDPIYDPDFNADKQVPCSLTAAQAAGPHVAALGMTFYTGSVFPSDYNTSIFIAQHGSWNRQPQIGHRVMNARVLSNGTVVEYRHFVDGWLDLCLNESAPCGRPVDVIQYYDGSLLVSDDKQGLIYRIAYGQQCAPGAEGGAAPAADPGSPPAASPPASASRGLFASGLGMVFLFLSWLVQACVGW